MMRCFFLLFLPFLAAAASPEFRAALETPAPIRVIRSGEEKQLALLLENRSGKARSCTVSIEVLNLDGDSRSVGEPNWEAAAGEIRRFGIPVPPEFGVYRVRCRIIGDATLFSHEESFVYWPGGAPPPREKGDGFHFGAHTHLERYPDRDQEIMADAIALCGLSLVRQAVSWTQVEKTRGQLNFDAADRYLGKLRKRNIDVLILLGGIRPWAVDRNWKPLSKEADKGWNGLPDAEQFAEFAGRVADRYREQCGLIEIRNEPDLVGFANYSLNEYLRLFRLSSAAIRKAAPGMKIMNGGFAGLSTHARSPEPDYMRKFLERTRGEGFDLLAIHFHDPYRKYRKNLEELARLMKKTGVDKPIFPNETAYPSAPGFASETEQAEVLWKKLIYSWSHGAYGYVWYNLRAKRGSSPTEAGFGLLTPDFQPKPVYAAYHTLIARLSGATFLDTPGNLPEEAEFFRFRTADGGEAIVFWSNRPESRKLMMFSGVGEQAFLGDLWGNETELPVSGGVVGVTPRSRPALLRLPAPGKTAWAGEFLAFEQKLLIPEGTEAEFPLTLTNPLKRSLAGTIEWRGSNALDVPSKPAPFRLAPGESAAFPCRLRLKPGAAGESTLRIICRAEGFWTGVLEYPVTPIILPGTEFPARPHFRLDKKEQVTSLIPSAEDTAHLFWKSPDDLSADLFLALEERHFQFRAVVRDDVHAQPFRGEDIWKGDAIQLGLAIPGQRGIWEFGFALGNDGERHFFCWRLPEGFRREKLAEDLTWSATRDEVSRATIYEVRLHFRALGLGRDVLREGIRLNFLVNDHDGGGRESLMRVSEGLGTGTPDPHLWPVIGLRSI